MRYVIAAAEEQHFGRASVEYLCAWLKRHTLANFCPRSLAGLKATARGKPRSGQRRQSIITAFWKQAEL